MSFVAQAFHEGGWGMWPTLVLGTLALALAVRNAASPKPATMPLIVGLGAATLLAGALGVVTGLVATVRTVQRLPVADQASTALVGVGESLMNAVLALLLATLVALAAGVGGYRQRVAKAPA